ncbi:MAG: hypothetical protein ACI8RZ_001347 [Myxococcota bacterium]|jgi:hypothetical protein
MLLCLLSLARADDTTTGARIGPVPVTAISDPVFWSHVTLTPVLQAPDGISLEEAEFDVLAGTMQLHLAAEAQRAVVIDWSASYLQVAGAAVPVVFTPQLPSPTLSARTDTYGYAFAPPHRRHAPPRHSAIPDDGDLRGTLTRLDGAPLMARPRPGEAPPAVVLQLVDGEHITVMAGVALSTGLIPAHCADLKKTRGESWLNLLGGAVLTSGLAFTSGRIYIEERGVLGNTIPTLPTTGLFALAGGAAATTVVMGTRVSGAYRDLAEQCPE